MARLHQQPANKSVRLVTINLDAFKQDSVTLGLRSDLQVRAIPRKLVKRSNINFTWYGTLSEIPGTAVLVVHDENVTGTVRSDKELYKIRPIGSGLHALIEVDQSKLPKDDPPSFMEKERKEERGREDLPIQRKADESAQADTPAPEIEVLVAYTQFAERESGDITGLIQLAIDETNQSYDNSGIALRLHLAHTHRVRYNEGGRSFPMILQQFADTDGGLMDEIHSLRQKHRADVAVLLVHSPGEIGGAALTIKAEALSSFAVVQYDQATGTYVFGHEIGHLQGARHNPEEDPKNFPYPHGHGYLNGSNWRTIMALNCDPPCNAYRLQYWSNPDVTYDGVPMGTTHTHNNSRVLNETGEAVAAFRPTTGAIWRYTGTPCSGNSCPGWQLLDNNPKTTAIVAAGTQLYQLHEDGAIWRYTDTPCSGNSCPGWQRLDNNPKTAAIVAAGTQLYQLHEDGAIWRFTGTPCSGNFCPGWRQLGNNPNTVAIAATGTQLYQLHEDGAIWRFTGTPCSGNSCLGWQQLGSWQQLGDRTAAIVAASSELYRLHNNGAISRYTGTPCSGNSCPGWQQLDNNPDTVAIVTTGTQLYQLHASGWILRYKGTSCNDKCWQPLDNNRRTIMIRALGNGLYQLHNDGAIWRYTGTPCSGNSCSGWKRLDNNIKTESITGDESQVYQLH
jgi:hypothetical protein